MHATPESSPVPLPAWAQRLRVTWDGMSRRDRRVAIVVAWVAALALLWMKGVAPAWQTLHDAPLKQQQLEAQLDEMRRLAAEARGLRDAPRLPPDQAQTALRAATARLGDKARLQMQADRAVVQMTGVAGPDIVAWLAEVRAGARMRPLQAQLLRSGQGYNGTVVVALGHSS